MCVGASVGSTCMCQFFPTTYVLASNSWSQLCRECLNVMSSITSLQSPGWPQTCYVTKDDLTLVILLLSLLEVCIPPVVLGIRLSASMHARQGLTQLYSSTALVYNLYMAGPHVMFHWHKQMCLGQHRFWGRLKGDKLPVGKE
jgi:hypothetical protein